MTNKPSADEIITYKHKRNYIQFGGPRPTNAVRYAGQDAQYLVIEGVGSPEQGGVEPIWVPDPVTAGKYRLVGRKQTPPDLASASVRMLEKHGSIPRQLSRIGCAFNLYELTGNCGDLSDFLQGWSDYILVYSHALVTDKDLGTRSAWDSDEMQEDVLSVTLADIFPVGALAFGVVGETEIAREVVDVVFGSIEQCGDCGPYDEGTLRAYAITESSGAASPGLPAELIYTLDGGATMVEQAIDGLGATADPTAIDIVGSRLVILVNSENAYYWADVNSRTGVPGSFTKVTAGFVALKNPNDLYVAGPREVYIAGNGGYIYKATDITAGVSVINAGAATTQDLLRIDGIEEAIVAVGRGSDVVRSINRGITFATTTTEPSSIPTDLLAVEVLSADRIWVGTDTGRKYYTVNGGETWVHQSFDGAGAGRVEDIVFVSDEVGYFSHTTNTPTARLFSTWDGGANWTRSQPRINSWPVFGRGNRIAVPRTSLGVAANAVLVAGLSGGGTDGILVLGQASRL